MPPPPVFKGDSIVNTPISEHIIDSLLGISLNIGVFPKMESHKLNTEHLKISEDFAEILDALWKVEQQSMAFTTEIDTRSKHQVVLADSLILKASADWAEYDLVYNFSPLFFNANCTEAVVSIGLSRSKLWGYGGYYWYKKDKKGNWYCQEFIVTEKW
ncbi:hypothetical protein ACFFVB_01500 [Formosa undariae]|uniref:DUF4440 domain-containing protein n=1 Tax=Formosa undariae TaxID=1325436 RepID=A0ABV5EX81_9FLAO